MIIVYLLNKNCLGSRKGRGIVVVVVVLVAVVVTAVWCKLVWAHISLTHLKVVSLSYASTQHKLNQSLWLNRMFIKEFFYMELLLWWGGWDGGLGWGFLPTVNGYAMIKVSWRKPVICCCAHVPKMDTEMGENINMVWKRTIDRSTLSQRQQLVGVF